MYGTLLQINTNAGWNSTGMIAQRLAEIAGHAGWRSVLAYGREECSDCFVPQGVELLKIGSRADQMLHALHTRVSDRHGLASNHATRRFIVRAEELSPDVVHLHNLHGYYLNYELLFDWLASSGVPVVWTFHDLWPVTGHCAYPSLAGCERWLTGCGECRMRREYPSAWLADRSAANFISKRRAFTRLRNLRLVVVSHWLAGELRRSFLSDYPVEVISNYVEPPENPLPPRSAVPVVLTMASVWEERKGLADFVRLRSLLPADWAMEVVGLTPAQIAALPQGITGRPRLGNRREVEEAFARATVFVNPSRGETLSMTNLEAQACGTPVVAYDAGGMPETISPSTGRVVSVGNIPAMAEAVREIILSPGRFSPEACRAFVAGKFSIHSFGSDYLKLYSESVAESAVRPHGV